MIFLNRIPIALKLIRTDKWDYIKSKSFCTDNDYQNKRQFTEWKIIFFSYSSDKGLIFRIYKELKKIKHQKNK
jgi:hypothetical protein